MTVVELKENIDPSQYRLVYGHEPARRHVREEAPFAFLRGSAAVMADDLSRTPARRTGRIQVTTGNLV